jgi:DNA-binding transcriptional LysR family regulator
VGQHVRADEFLPEVLARFMVRHPEIKVDVEEQLSDEIARAIVDGLADIGVFAEGTPLDGLSVQPFQTDELVLICARDHAFAARGSVSFREALAHPFVGLNRGSSLFALITDQAQATGCRCACACRCRASARCAGWSARASGSACCRAPPARRCSRPTR